MVQSLTLFYVSATMSQSIGSGNDAQNSVGMGLMTIEGNGTMTS